MVLVRDGISGPTCCLSSLVATCISADSHMGWSPGVEDEFYLDQATKAQIDVDAVTLR
jgi:hypothetical protein